MKNTDKTVILVLGKRLVNGMLTKEAVRRVKGLLTWLEEHRHTNTDVIFSGGASDDLFPGTTESDLMASLFTKEFTNREAKRTCSEPDVVSRMYSLGIHNESKSLTTIENFVFSAPILADIAQQLKTKSLKLVLLSTDYHLERIFEIQKRLPQQGLLAIFEEKCRELGLQIQLSRSVDDHVAITFVPETLTDELFLKCDQLTLFRVLLESKLQAKSVDPDQLNNATCFSNTDLTLFEGAKETVKQATLILSQLNSNEYGQIVTQFSDLDNLIEKCLVAKNTEQLRCYYSQFSETLVELNRRLDPDLSSNCTGLV